MELDLRWKRVGRNGDENNTGKREKVGKARTSAKPVQLSAASNQHVPSSMPGKKRRGTEGWGRAKKVDRKKGGQGGGVRYSFSLSHIGLLSLLRCPE